MSYHGKELAGRFYKEKDGEAIRAFFDRAPFYETLFMRGAARDLANFQGWWYGVHDTEDTVQAMACVASGSANLYGLDTESITHLASDMSRQSRTVRDGKSHHAMMAKCGLRKAIA